MRIRRRTWTGIRNGIRMCIYRPVDDPVVIPLPCILASAELLFSLQHTELNCDVAPLLLVVRELVPAGLVQE